VTDRDAAARWVERYLHAWESNDRADIGALFTDEAIYRPTPMSPGWRGRETIVKEWLGRMDEPGDWTFEHELLAVEGDLVVLRGVTRYKDPTPDYENLWLIWLEADGRAREFIEYWIEHPRESETA
jgi:ketosteroid isomerase-like protein